MNQAPRSECLPSPAVLVHDQQADKVRRIALFLPSLAGGGAERVFLTLAEGFLDRGIPVDLVAAGLFGKLLKEIDPRVRVINLGKSRVLFSLPGLARYLKTEQPPVLLSALTHANLIAVWARTLAHSNTRLILTEHLSLQVQANLKHRLLYPLAKWFYPKAEALVAVSDGVADDLQRLLPPKTDIKVIYNPVNREKISARSKETPDHPWLVKKEEPVLLAVGRLHPNKDYPTLLQALAQINARFPCRLIILGEGKERRKLEDLVRHLGLENIVSIPGFVENPYPYMRNADVFVMSSVFEGLPTVLIEALTCGVNVVSTDCPSGPAEILDHGEYGVLVPIRKPQLLAEAICQTLEEPANPVKARERAAWFDVSRVTERYLQLIHQTLSDKANGNGKQ